MTSAQVGAYIRLLAWSWGNGPLPTDERALASLIHASVRELRALWPAVGQKWRRVDSGWINARLEEQRARLNAFLALQSEKGKASARSRGATTERQPNANRGSTEVQPGHQPEGQPKGNSSVFDLRSADQEPPGKEHRGIRARETPGFAAFWATYPLKVGKAKALEAWRTHVTPADVALISTALSWQVTQPKWREQGGKFIPHPTSYLNQHRWDDELFQSPTETLDEQWTRIERGGGRFTS